MTLPLANGSGVITIVAQLRAAIENGNYPHGQRLPAERDLAAHYKASRTTVREALSQLESEELVVRKVGSGTFVNRPEIPLGGDIANVTSPLELMEVREAIEPHLARMAVMHASAKDLELLEKTLLELENTVGNQTDFSNADERFHLALAKATGNPLMVWIYSQINNVRCHEQWMEMKRKVLSKEAIEVYNRHHRALVEAIRKRDTRLATVAVGEHMEQARRDLIGVEPSNLV